MCGSGKSNKLEREGDAVLFHLILNDLSHSEESFRLHALCNVDNNVILGNIGRGCLCSCSDKGAGHGKYDILAFLDSLGNIFCIFKLLGKNNAGEINMSLRAFKRVDLSLKSRPDNDIVAVFREESCKGDAPSTASEYCDFHIGLHSAALRPKSNERCRFIN